MEDNPEKAMENTLATEKVREVKKLSEWIGVLSTTGRTHTCTHTLLLTTVPTGKGRREQNATDTGDSKL